MQALIGGLIQAAATIVGKVLLSLGIGYVTYTGFSFLLDTAKTVLFDAISGNFPIVVQLAGVLQIGTCVNIFASTAAAKLTYAGLDQGGITRLVTKG